MAETSTRADSPGDPYQDTDQDEPMDTDSEHESATRASNLGEAEPIPDDDSERMEISDNEDSDEDEVERNHVIHVSSAASSHQIASTGTHVTGTTVSPSSALPASAKTQPHSSSIHPARRISGMLQDITDPRNLVHGLPIPIWQKVFTAVPPASLGQLLACTRLFHAILAPQAQVEREFQQRFQKDRNFLSSEFIWQVSRKNFASDMPKPLSGKSELDMWRLLRGTICQICRQRKPLTTSYGSADPWHSGPGSEGIRVIWPCGIRICVACLLQRCQQEISLQLSSTFPSFLIQALPAILLTQYNDWIPESTLLSRPPSPHLQIRKLYYQPQIDSVLLQFRNVRDLGEAAAEEWVKGLDRQRSDILADANRWEQWELKGGLKKVDIHHRPKSIPPIPPAIGLPHGPPPVAFQTPAMSPPHANYQEQNFPHYQPHGHGPIVPSMPSMPYPGPPPPGFNQFQPPMFMPGPNVAAGRPRRSLQEVNEARAARRREIERRCLELNPPINPKVLAHMQSFQAALQISFPFTDKDWEVLKPRLLAQREAAEAQEAVLAEQLRAIQTTAARPSLGTLLTKDPNEMIEDHWELLQAPLHEKLGQFADECIKDVWEGGSKLNPETASHFVADVLLTARGKYQESFSQPPGGNESVAPRIPISLESMKWVYDNKLKNVAEIHQKDLFLCNGCDANSKLYGFEGVLQHYAAKHTTDLSLGNVIVNWRAEWPDTSPFAPYLKPGEDDKTGDTGYQPGPATPNNHASAPYMSNQDRAFSYGLLDSSGRHSMWSDADVSAGRHFMSQPGSFSQHNEQASGTGNDFFAVSQLPYVPTSPGSDMHRQQLAEMAQISRDLWNATMGIKELQPSVRIRVLLRHMSTRFEKKFNKRPDISMFLHGLNENSQMRPIRSLNGLACKACGLHSPVDRKSFTLPTLVNHFKNMHLSSAEGSSHSSTLDWRIDMIEVPENTAIENLVTSNGMDDRKFQLIAATFPDAFPSPLPPLSTLKESKAKEEANRVRLENLGALKAEPVRVGSQERPPPASDEPYRDDSRRPKRRLFTSRSPAESDRESVRPLDEDEYDPSVPSFVGEIVARSGLPRNFGSRNPASVRLPPGIISLGVVEERDQPQSPHTQGGYADRLLRHHRALPRRATETEPMDQNIYSNLGNNGAVKLEDTSASENLSADQFLRELAASRSIHQNRVISSNDQYAVLSENSVHQSGAMRHSRVDPVLEMSQPVDYYGASSTSEVRQLDRQYAEDLHWRDRQSENQRDNPAVRMEHSAYHYHNRDRSRSPRRSIPRDYVAYDPNVPSPLFEERFDMRWRGEPAPRGHVYRGNPEPIYGIGPGNDFIARDAQGRNVRYIAMPVEEYEAQTRRYIPAESAIPPEIQYATRPAEVMDTRADGGVYVIGERDPVRYVDDSMERQYRDYPPR